MSYSPYEPLRVAVSSICIMFLLTGCAVKQMELTESGFLSGYSGLEIDEESDGMHVYRNSYVNIGKRYSKVLIAPVVFELDSSLKEHDMDYEDRRKIADYFHEKLIEGLMEHYEIVDKPGRDVLLFRAAVTDVLPNKVYLNLHWSTNLLGGGIGGASLEAELVDSITNERILSFVDAKKGMSAIKQPEHLVKNYKSGLTKWGHTKEVLGDWAQIMVSNLNDLREKYSDKLDADLAERKSLKEKENF